MHPQLKFTLIGTAGLWLVGMIVIAIVAAAKGGGGSDKSVKEVRKKQPCVAAFAKVTACADSDEMRKMLVKQRDKFIEACKRDVTKTAERKQKLRKCNAIDDCKKFMRCISRVEKRKR